MIRRFLLACGALAALAAAGCGQNEQRVIEMLPDAPRRPAQARTYQQPGRKDYSPWLRPEAQAPKWQPLPLTSIAPEPEWRPAVGLSPRWTYIVVHHSASEIATPSSMSNAHKARGWDELGYHFVIGNGRGYGDGQVYVGPRWKKQKHGAYCKTKGGAYNMYGIGICLMGNFNNHEPSQRQMQSLARLVAYLQKQCDIPPSRVLTHGGITGKTECPGRHFSRQELLIRLNAYR